MANGHNSPGDDLEVIIMESVGNHSIYDTCSKCTVITCPSLLVQSDVFGFFGSLSDWNPGYCPALGPLRDEVVAAMAIGSRIDCRGF